MIIRCELKRAHLWIEAYAVFVLLNLDSNCWFFPQQMPWQSKARYVSICLERAQTCHSSLLGDITRTVVQALECSIFPLNVQLSTIRDFIWFTHDKAETRVNARKARYDSSDLSSHQLTTKDINHQSIHQQAEALERNKLKVKDAIRSPLITSNL